MSVKKVIESKKQFIISIIELDFHFDVLDSFIKTFENSNYTLHVFTTKKNVFLLKGINYSSNIVFHVFKSFSKFIFLLQNKKIINSSDIVFINTIASDFGSYLAISRNLNTILRIHNVNKQFNPNKSIVFPNSFFSLWKFSSYIFRQIILKGFPIFRRIINKRIKYFTFPDDSLKDVAISKKYLSPLKIIESIPLKTSRSSEETYPFSTSLSICIIGSTDRKRRDYQPVINALQHLYSDPKVTVKINLTLLGKTKGVFGHQVVNELNSINSENFTLKHFSENVSEIDFIDIMNKTHLIISPIVKDSKIDIYHEIYGETKTSGSILDFIKFGIVTFTPDYYNSNKNMSEFILKYYNEKNLAEQILHFFSNPDYLNSLNLKAKKHITSNYSQEEVFKLCDSAFQKILNNK